MYIYMYVCMSVCLDGWMDVMSCHVMSCHVMYVRPYVYVYANCKKKRRSYPNLT